MSVTMVQLVESPTRLIWSDPLAVRPAVRRHVFIVLALGFLLRACIILRWPIIFGGDTIMRLANRDHILISYQLPGLQVLLYVLSYISPGSTLVRYFVALIGALAGWGFYLFATHFLDEPSAFLAALLFVSNPFLLVMSTVPYQEMLMLAGLFFSAHFFLSGKMTLSSLALGIACLTRYEAWIACPLLFFAYAKHRNWSTRELLRGMVLFGWAPLGWMLYRHGLAPGGTYVLNTTLTLWRLLRYVHLSWTAIKQTPLPVGVLAIIGFVAIWRGRLWKQQPAVILIAAFVALFLISILFSAHGLPPQPERIVSSREAHLLICAAVLLAGFGLAQYARFRQVLFLLGFALGLVQAARLVANETAQPSFQLSYNLAKYLDRTVPANRRVIVLTQPTPRELLEAYLAQMSRTRGDSGLTDARHVMESVDTSPPDYQRTLAHSGMGKQRLLNFGGMASFWAPASQGPDLHGVVIAVWSDFSPGNAIEQHIYETAVKGRLPEYTLHSGPLAVSIYTATDPENASAHAGSD